MGQLRVEYGTYGAARGVLGGQVDAFDADPTTAVTLSVTASPTVSGSQPSIPAGAGDSVFVVLTALDTPIYVDVAPTPDPTTEPRWLVVPGTPLRLHVASGIKVSAMLAADVATAAGKVGLQVAGSDVAAGNPVPVSVSGGATAALQGTTNTTLAQLHTDLLAATPAGTNNIGLVGIQDGLAPNGTTGYPLSAVGTFFTQDTIGYPSISVQVTAIAASSTIVFEGSSDGVVWVAQGGYSSASTGASADVSSTTTTGAYRFVVMERYFRVRQSVYGGAGATTVVPILRATELPVRAVYMGAAPTLTVQSVVASGSGGVATTTRLVSAAASTNPIVAKAAAGRVYGVRGYNKAAASRTIKFHNKTTAPVAGTDAVLFSLEVPPGAFEKTWSDLGFYFSTGIALSMTVNPADTDATALTAGDITSFHVDYA